MMKRQEIQSEDLGRTSISTSQFDQQQQPRVGPSSHAAIESKEQAGKWAVLAIVAVGVFMATLDSSIVNISLPTIARYFGVPLNGAVEWVIISYLVISAAVLLTAGRLADMIGRKIVWTTGLIVFTGSSALCGASPSLGFLIGMRALQGLGSALLMAISPALVTSAFPANERGRALGFNAITVALGVSVGPTLGGLITAYLSWRWIFYVNVPIGIIGIFATLRVLTERFQRNPGRFDPLGATLLAVGLAAITAGLSFGQELGWTSPLLITMLVIGLGTLLILPLVERHVSNPIIDLSLFRNRVFVSSNLSLILSFLALFAVSFMLPFYLEELRGFSTELAGLLLTPLPITIAILAPISGSLADRFGTRWLTAIGMIIVCIGLLLVSQLNEKSSIWDIVWRLVLTGIGQAMFQSPNNSALLGSAPRNQQGSASGFLATGRTVGQSLSVALAGAIFAGLGGSVAGSLLTSAHSGQNIPNIGQLQQTFVHSFQVTFIVSAVIAAFGIFASLVRGKEQRKVLSTVKEQRK